MQKIVAFHDGQKNMITFKIPCKIDMALIRYEQIKINKQKT